MANETVRNPPAHPGRLLENLTRQEKSIPQPATLDGYPSSANDSLPLLNKPPESTKMRVVLVCGGVISGVGKGEISSSSTMQHVFRVFRDADAVRAGHIHTQTPTLFCRNFPTILTCGTLGIIGMASYEVLYCSACQLS